MKRKTKARKKQEKYRLRRLRKEQERKEKRKLEKVISESPQSKVIPEAEAPRLDMEFPKQDTKPAEPKKVSLKSKAFRKMEEKK